MGSLAMALLVTSWATAMTPKRGTMEGRAPRTEVAVDPRVELVSIVFRLAGAEEYQRGRVGSYAAAVDTYFAPFADHSAVQMVSTLRERYFISHDAVVKLAVHAEDAVGWQEIVPLDGVDTLGTRWRPAAARAFLQKLERFAEDSDFTVFLERHRALFETTASRLESQLSTADLAWLDGYFGSSTGSLRVVPGMLTGRASYGATVDRSGGPDRYAIVGVERVDEAGEPNFDSAVIETVIHELSHSYINPVLKQSAGDFEQAGEALYLSQRPKMERQAYRNGYTVVNETLTRACTNRFLQARRSPTEVEGDYAYNRSRGFVWIPEVGDWLEEYEQGRDRFPTFADFMPVLAERLAELTEDLPRSQDELEARRPRVVEVSPTPGSQSVDPELEVIVVTFDRPMRAGSWSVVGGGPRYPETGEPSFDENRRIFSLPVRLEPEHDYELWLNRGPYTSFLSDEGVPLAPFQITFRTARR